MPGTEHPLPDVRVPGQPERERRHVERDVLVQQRRQTVHVVRLEGGDVPGQQGLVVLVQGRGRAGRGGVGGERGPGPLERAVHRGDGDAEQFGDLVGPPAEHLAQDQHRPLPGRQPLQRGDEGEPHRFALRGHLGRVGRLGQHPAVRRRAEPGDLGQSGVGRGGHGGRAGQVHRAGPGVAAVQRVQTDVGGDPVEPGAQRGAALEAAVVAPGPDHGVLDGVLGLEDRAEHAVAVPGQLRPVPLQLELDRLLRHQLGHRLCPHSPVAVDRPERTAGHRQRRRAPRTGPERASGRVPGRTGGSVRTVARCARLLSARCASRHRGGGGP